MDKDYKLLWAGLIMGLSLIISSFVVADTFYKVKALSNTLSTTGSAKKAVTSDAAKWQTSFSRSVTADTIKNGYAQMGKDLEIVKRFFADNGVAESDLVISPVFTEQDYSNYNSPVKQYVLRQTVEMQSGDVSKIASLSKNTEKIVSQGVIFSPSAPEYYYTKLPDIRVELLGDAVKDARNRANKIAESGGKKVSNLSSASVGVTQVMAVNSTDVSDYGTYDTSKIDKEVTITVRAVFNLE